MGGGLSSVGAALGSGLSAIGLTGVAQSFGLAPATFLGLTAASWAMAAASVAAVGVGYFFTRKTLLEINQERFKGGLAAVTWAEIIAEARDYEKQALMNILEELEAETGGDIVLDRANEKVVIRGKTYKVGGLKYIIENNGGEYVAQRTKVPFKKIVLFVIKDKDK